VPPDARGPGHIPRHRPPTRLVPSTLFRFEVEEKLTARLSHRRVSSGCVRAKLHRRSSRRRAASLDLLSGRNRCIRASVNPPIVPRDAPRRHHYGASTCNSSRSRSRRFGRESDNRQIYARRRWPDSRGNATSLIRGCESSNKIDRSGSFFFCGDNRQLRRNSCCLAIMIFRVRSLYAALARNTSDSPSQSRNNIKIPKQINYISSRRDVVFFFFFFL